MKREGPFALPVSYGTNEVLIDARLRGTFSHDSKKKGSFSPFFTYQGMQTNDKDYIMYTQLKTKPLFHKY